MEYTLADKFTTYRNAIGIVGVGGTGSLAAEGLARLLLGYPQLRLLLIDGDRVEARNLGRQNFTQDDLWRFKSQALAERLARKYRTPVAYSISPLEEKKHDLGRGPLTGCALVLGCVDNAAARSAIASHISTSQWWLDAGNGAEFGQLLVGNADGRHLEGAFDQEKGVCHALPLPTLVRPELLVPPGAGTNSSPRQSETGTELSCAEAVAAGQGPTVNTWMAALVVEAVRRLLEGRLEWWQCYLELETMGLRTVPATPEGVARLLGIREKKLLERR